MLFLRKYQLLDYENLLFVEFSHTIDKVQENTEFYWRCQRYAFVREYFESPPFAYPPLILLPHLVIIFLALQRKCCAKLCNNQVGSGDPGSKPKSLIQIFSKIDHFTNEIDT